MRALVVGAAPTEGSPGLVRRLAATSDLVVAADGAAEWCIQHGVVPHIAVGDFDSALPGAPRRLSHAGVEVMRYPAEKDESDLDLAVTVAREHGATALLLTACTGYRLDHTLATLGTLVAHSDLHPEIAEPDLSAWTVDSAFGGGLRIDLPVGTTVSVMAIGNASGVTLTGMRYPLEDADLGPLSSLGLSNVMADTGATVTVTDGVVLVIAPKLGISF